MKKDKPMAPTEHEVAAEVKSTEREVQSGAWIALVVFLLCLFCGLDLLLK